ncbi:hypothetical protein CHS0354_037676 [Potamilus streckersoni]|uniref:SH2 domain-containing protein n=1 Tax=Potamilus streckersoni TaxID=2493646 RepID=A0AAE0T0H4_9BIVA|nr:hypothetical protein CHS0354_037676 [Potamilus streckersoni]
MRMLLKEQKYSIPYKSSSLIKKVPTQQGKHMTQRKETTVYRRPGTTQAIALLPGGDSDYESPDEKNIPARPQARPGQQPKSSAPGPRRVAPPPPTEDEFYEDPDAPKANNFHGGPLPPIPAVPKTVSDLPPVLKSPKVPHRSRPKTPDVAETEETYEDPDAKPVQRPPQNKPQAFEGTKVPTPIPTKISAPPPVSQTRTPQLPARRPPPTPQEPEVYEDPDVQTSIAPKNSAPPPVSQTKTPQLPARRPPPTPQEPEDYENSNDAVQKFRLGKKLPPPPPSTTGSNMIDDEYMEMDEKTQPGQPAHDIEESDADYLDPDPKIKVEAKTKKPAGVQVLPKLEPPKLPETKLAPRKQLPPPPTDSDPTKTVPAPPVPKVAHVHSQPATSSQSSGSANEEEEELKTKPWYHGASTRQEVEPKLMQLKTNGMYCVRQSSGKPNQPYTLVVFCEDRIFNLPIRLRNDRKYALGGEKTDEVAFGSIVELVRFFRRNYLILNGMKGQQTQLKKPLPK